MKRITGAFPALCFLGYFPPIWMIGVVMGLVAGAASELASLGFGGGVTLSEVMRWPSEAYRDACGRKADSWQRRSGVSRW